MRSVKPVPREVNGRSAPGRRGSFPSCTEHPETFPQDAPTPHASDRSVDDAVLAAGSARTADSAVAGERPCCARIDPAHGRGAR